MATESAQYGVRIVIPGRVPDWPTCATGQSQTSFVPHFPVLERTADCCIEAFGSRYGGKQFNRNGLNRVKVVTRYP
ncbi:hypothetical protein Y032_1034g3454 [Ancylostoma ceylanicum]|uniref:Uncharacterized protein n=1 Tax=Ancylostoma ceylanicum TaxID=53326 RepID=A0A016W7I9_9BILA|nr:hypothetical protein Y032_1034g3454 [Ancylostoma ceylanicum]